MTEKKKKNVLTLRLSEEQTAVLNEVKSVNGEKTSAGAIMVACEDYLEQKRTIEDLRSINYSLQREKDEAVQLLKDYQDVMMRMAAFK